MCWSTEATYTIIKGDVIHRHTHTHAYKYDVLCDPVTWPTFNFTYNLIVMIELELISSGEPLQFVNISCLIITVDLENHKR